jgi:peptide/nickel transport system permease protein
MATALEISRLDVLPERPTGPITWPSAIWRFARRKPLGGIGGLIVVVFLFSAVFVDQALIGSDKPLLALQGYNDQKFGDENLDPSLSHPFGTDELGRDIFSRILYGARISAIIGFATVIIAGIASLLLGAASGYLGGWIDTLSQRLVDILLAIPAIILVIYSLSVFAGQSGPYGRMFWIIIIFSVITTASSVRVVRGAAISTSQNQFIDAARTIGASEMRIIARHVVPNVVPTMIVLATVQVGAVILGEAAVSFLGYGIPAPFPSWGVMISLAGSQQFTAHPLQAVWPGAAIALTVFGYNMLGDALRDVLDPRLRGGR